MKILIVSAQPLLSLGGVQTFSLRFAAEAKKMAHEVWFLTTQKDSTGIHSQVESVPTIKLRAVQVMNGRLPVPYRISEMREAALLISKYFRGQKDAIVVIQTRLYPTSILMALLCRFLNVRCIVIDHGSGHLFDGTSFIGSLANFYEHFSTLIIRLLGVQFYAVSKASQNWLKHFGIQNSSIVSNGVDASLLDVKVKEFSSASKTLHIAYCGRLIKGKGVIELIEAVEIASRDESVGDIQLKIVGDGPLFRDIEIAANGSRRVEIVGALSHAETKNVIANSDIIVLASTYPEGFPTVALESAALGRIIIATQLGCGDGLLVDGYNGFLLSSGSAQSIAESIIAAANLSSAEKVQFGFRIRDQAKTSFLWSTIVKKFLSEVVQ